MDTSNKCPSCGTLVPGDAPKRLCPRCLAGLALGDTTARNQKSGAQIPSVRAFGDYELLGPIAEGGMGIVYLAQQLSLNRSVAVKMIRSGQLATKTEVHRFRTEAEAAANLEHPNIVPIYEIGEHQGNHYFTMKLMESGNLGELISERLNRQLDSVIVAPDQANR